MVSDKILWLRNGTCVNYCDHPGRPRADAIKRHRGELEYRYGCPGQQHARLCRASLRRRGLFRGEGQVRPNDGQFFARIPGFLGLFHRARGKSGGRSPCRAPAGFQHFIEDDFFEFDIGWASSIAYGTAIHDWYGIYSSTCQEGYRAGSPGFCDVTNNGVGTTYNNFVSTKRNKATIDWIQWHTVGQLWVPGSPQNRTPGYVRNFIDGQRAYSYDGTGKFTPYSKAGWVDLASPPFIDPLNSATAFSVLDSDHLMIILGTGPGQPFTVGYVKVWQIPGCAT